MSSHRQTSDSPSDGKLNQHKNPTSRLEVHGYQQRARHCSPPFSGIDDRQEVRLLQRARSGLLGRIALQSERPSGRPERPSAISQLQLDNRFTAAPDKRRTIDALGNKPLVGYCAGMILEETFLSNYDDEMHT
ncbi:hypothetical protein PCANC_12311 [Puccinia coronata f. sp. avenae]|nr:hypothetical protein PCANC_12311 [Puccinia coronata f. sp. avenae]